MFAELTDLFAHEPWHSYAKGVAVTNVTLKPEVAFLRAIPANAVVCTSVLLGQQARDMIGKLVLAPSSLTPPFAAYSMRAPHCRRRPCGSRS
jgi:formate/nitrite transporter FocA (FNT family)